MFTKSKITTTGDVFRDEKSLAFDGSNDYVELSGAFSYNVHSISAWVKPTAIVGSSTIFDYRDANNDGILLTLADGDVVYQIDNTDGHYNSVLTLNQWWHIVATNDGSTSTIYVNGVSVETADTSGETINVSGSAIPRIGSRSHTSADNYFNGNISEVAIYNSALTINQVKTIYNGREPYNHKEGVASGNLQAWYRMGDGVIDSKHLAEDDTQVISDMVTPTLGSNLWDSAASVFESGTYNWTAASNNTIENDSNTLKITYVDNANGAALDLKDGHDLSSDLTVGKVYKIKFDAKVNTGTVQYQLVTTGGSDNLTWELTNTSFETVEGYFLCGHSTNCYIRNKNMGAGQICYWDNLSIQEVGGNAGIMQNMSNVDFEGDTP